MTTIEAAQREFHDASGYLDTATVGLPSRATIEAVRAALDGWTRGSNDLRQFDADVDRCRAAYGALVSIGEERVAIIGQVSVAAAMVASSLPAGARVVCAEEDFHSVLFPFLVDDRLDVVVVPLDRLLDALGPGTDAVAVSAVQSADGRVIDLDALATLAADHDIRTFVDVSHGAGWLPIDAGRFDVTACAGYKWLCSPRGTGYTTVGEHVDWVVPRHSGWYSVEDPWERPYGPPFRQARSARAFDVSPAWFDYAGAAPALELLASVGVNVANAHSVGLANRFRAEIGLAASNSAIVAIDGDSDKLDAAGIRTAGRAGRVRTSWYLYNNQRDVDSAIEALGLEGKRSDGA